MTYIEKLRFLQRESKPHNSFKGCNLDFSMPPMSSEDMARLTQAFPHLPSTYKEFMQEFNGPYMEWIRFCGLHNKTGNELFSNLEIYDTYIFDGKAIKKHICLLAVDVCNDPYFLLGSGEVIKYEYCDPPQKLSKSFEEFMDKWVMGSEYATLYPYVKEKAEQNDHWDMLKSLGWA